MVSRTVIIAVVVVVAAVAGGLILFSQGPSPSPSGVKEFTVTLEEHQNNRTWIPDMITVKVGDKVKLVIVNGDTENPAAPTYHRFAITEYKIDSGDISPNKQYVAEFTADKAGTFKYFDPRPDEKVGNENVKHSVELGKLVVEP